MARAGTQRNTLLAEIEQLQAQFPALEAEAQFSDIHTAIGDFDAGLLEIPAQLEALRSRGYVHFRQLDQRLAALDAAWEETRPRVESALSTYASRLTMELNETERLLNSIQRNRSSIGAARSSISRLQGQIRAARDAIQGHYEGIQQELNQVSGEVATITQMMDRLDKSSEIRLLNAEGPLLAVEAEWQEDGKEGPKGVLFLTDQRLLFEQREEVVTKRMLGIFKTDSEKIQRLRFEARVSEIESVADREEGGFLGMGKADILEMVFAPTAPLSRARFQIKGQESADWAIMIKRIQTGEIDEYRAQEYVEELEEAEALAASFPTQCPNCFADLPTPPPGTESLTCEYCGTLITPQEVS